MDTRTTTRNTPKIIENTRISEHIHSHVQTPSRRYYVTAALLLGLFGPGLVEGCSDCIKVVFEEVGIPV